MAPIGTSRFRIAAAIVGGAALAACAQDNAHTVGMGQLVTLETDAPKSSWTIIQPGDVRYRVFHQDGKSLLLFASGCRRQQVVALCVAVRDDGSLALVRHVVNVEGDSPQPEPGPGPQPSPQPDFPPARFELAQLSYKLASQKVDRRYWPQAPAVADAFGSTASRIAATGMTEVEAVAELRSRNRAACGDCEGWSIWWRGITAALKKLQADGKIRTVKDVGEAWQEIATGLRAIPK